MIATEHREIQEAWDKIAEGFDSFVTPMSITFADDVFRLVNLHSGMRFLDVAAGSGALSIPAARAGAQVVAVDIAPRMIERLTVRAREEGLSNLKARVMDGYSLDLEDDMFDVSASQNGVSLFPDLMRGLRELVRVTKPGGSAVIVAFGPFRKAEFLVFFLEAMQAAIPDFTGIPMDPPPLPFQVADPEVLHQRMTAAGLIDVRVETVAQDLEIHSTTQLWDIVTNSNPIGAMLVADLTQEKKAEVQQVLDSMLRERAGGRGAAVLHNEINIGIGTK